MASFQFYLFTTGRKNNITTSMDQQGINVNTFPASCRDSPPESPFIS